MSLLSISKELKKNYKIVEILTDTLKIPKQQDLNRIESRKIVKVKIPSNAIGWGYYYESIEKYEIESMLTKKFFSVNDFIQEPIKDTIPIKYKMTMRKSGKSDLEVLAMRNEDANEFMLSEDGFCKSKRPEFYYVEESSLCEVGKCYGSDKKIFDNIVSNEIYLGLRNIEFTENNYIILQIAILTE